MAVIAALLALTLGLAGQDAPQQTPSGDQDQPATSLPDVTVEARPTDEAVRDFVGRVADPVGRRSLAKWRGKVCPGVANISRATAQQLVDRITTVAAGLDIETGEPGCDPNLVVVFTDDANGLATGLVERNHDVYRRNVPGMEQGGAALRRFQDNDRPVRWWTLTVVLDSRTGKRAYRIPGEAAGGSVPTDIAAILGCDPEDCAAAAVPVIYRNSGGRLNSQLIDNIYKTIILVDIDRIGTVNTGQLGDYLAFVALAQVDGDADTGAFDTVLNLFDGGGQEGLTDWDQSYLTALYTNPSERASANAQAGAVANIMNRDRAAQAGR